MMMFNKNKIIITKDNVYKLEEKTLKHVNLREDKNFNNPIEIIILDEDMYIQTIDIPTGSFKIIDKIIENYIKEKFLNWDDLLFDYYVINKTPKACKVIFYCVNSKGLTQLRYIKENIKINNIKIFQQVIKREGNKLIKDKKYFIYSLFNNKIYALLIFNGLIMSQCILDNNEMTIDNIRDYIINTKNNMEYPKIENDINIWRIDFNFKFKPVNLKKYKFMEEICLNLKEEELFQIGIS